MPAVASCTACTERVAAEPRSKGPKAFSGLAGVKHVLEPVSERLQIKKDRLLAVIGATPELDAYVGASDKRAEPADADVVLLFVPDHASLRAKLEGMARERHATSILWVAYPKLSSKLAGDVNRDRIRAIALEYDLKTISQIAIDIDWSALRLKRVA